MSKKIYVGRTENVARNIFFVRYTSILHAIFAFKFFQHTFHQVILFIISS